MSFIWPVMLALLPLVPLAALAYLGLERRRRQRIARMGMLRTTSGAPGASGPSRASRIRRYLPVTVVLFGLIVMVVALARPQAVVGIPRDEGMIILAFDVSGSMAADDLAPTRMEAAKAAAKAFVERQPASIVIGVVAFSDSGLSVQVPTNDQEAVLAAIGRLQPQRGTSLGEGIHVSLDTIAAAEGEQNVGYYSNRSLEPTAEPSPVPPGTHTSAAIVLLTDGENTVNPDPLKAAQAAAHRGVRIHTIGIGSPTGTSLKVNGFTVHTQLNEAMLEQIASMTGGTAYTADDPQELQAIYDTLDTRLVVREESMEVTSILAGASLVLLLVGGLSSLFWLGRLP